MSIRKIHNYLKIIYKCRNEELAENFEIRHRSGNSPKQYEYEHFINDLLREHHNKQNVQNFFNECFLLFFSKVIILSRVSYHFLSNSRCYK